MNLTRLALAAALVWLGANLLLKRRPAARVDPDDGLAPLPSVDTGLPVRVRAMTVPARSFGTDSGVPRFAPGA
jgi:hypothetical protein